MTENFLIVLLLLTAMAATAAMARRFELTPALAFLAIGIALAFIPGMPHIELEPKVVLLIVLPPLIYYAGVSMSWREFKSNLRPIALLAIGCVIFTTCAVTAGAHFVLGLPWSLGFVLGAIVSPPDVVAPLAIARRLHLPHRILVILEGEGLANDATALILYRFAVLAVGTGSFSLGKATGAFVAIVACEVFFGIAVGWLSLRLRQWAHDERVEISLSLLTPYLAYWVPEHLGGSGVIATVAAGLYVSWNGPLLISAATRLQGIFFWDFVIWLIEGFLFLLMGFQMRLLMENSKVVPLHDVVTAIALTSAIVIAARFIWVFPGTYLTRAMSRRLRERDPPPPWRSTIVISFTGIRGVVSLAVALALPLTLPNGDAFPHRDLILFASFGVIFVTLVGIGLTLPLLVRLLGLSKHGVMEARHEREAEIAARREILQSARQSLEDITASRELSPSLVGFLEARHDTRTRAIPEPPAEGTQYTPATLGAPIVRELITAERKFLHGLLREGKITDETRRRIERDLDLEEAVVNNRERNTPL
ncbi:Na+/H+ antiporter [Bradyrhizobium sp. U87765 SZCCT0131]|uniref:Na+/H+ antiporter n=1 Tax=unclassified Bradyrhizobium TaxID=2631580 RepID=UPI001BA6222E|nr:MULTISPECIES: Na+/H+ antiporter [unclassified Bradyrhizobium]MBR1217091.1 Na+/H+ antiporter [Bradyrhizobium sp. U87765 SZCCT0131]MBR1259153.1 Na+/H+ antiporter [Bradyrhizobium sp. U87765 SZCCT0134]MBR1305294.1 Na+/H+ antiporter [Bradyrhizobium sp. U87765 SZCCT0110]MBR1321080.1 Na+/H+ antiporter [Bradyrhizobium sp. U87765 SZCCT0109]MBR1350266.1 Na+/H+ antiporter [Bradyrhizobium sp. U87765 SZCCT0048]